MTQYHPSILAATFLVLTSACLAQTPPADTPAFGVAVIRPTSTQDVMGSSHSHIWSAATDGHIRAQNVTPLALIEYAYALPEMRIEGAPDWTRSRKYDLEAKSDPAIDDQLSKLPSEEARARKRQMLQALLADRFALKVHEETRTLPIYSLVVAKGGPKFGASQKNGTTSSTTSFNGNTTMTIQGSDHTLRMLCERLSISVGRVVVDGTGLDGRFDLTLKFVADDVRNIGPDALIGPSLFSALPEQLGLKLEPGKGPVTILVVDHIGPPSDN